MKPNIVKKLSATVIAAALICIALLLVLTLGKYYEEIIGYTEFDIENFNAAILWSEDELSFGTAEETEASSSADSTQIPDGGEESSAPEETTAPPTVTEENPIELELSSVHPGMKWAVDSPEDTAKHIEFLVANGTSEEDATNLSLEYTVKIRTAKSLPLEYTLKGVDKDGNTVYCKASTDDEKVRVIKDESGKTETRYEYSFYLLGDKGEPTDTEAIFQLDPKSSNSGNVLNFNSHELIAEWRTEFSDKYMKEVEIIEIIVTASSLNKFGDPNYGSNKAPDEENFDFYSDGLIIIYPNSDGSTESTYVYELDLRGFHGENADSTDGTSGTEEYKFNVNIENGIGMTGTEHLYKYIDYSLELKIPYELLSITNPYTFSLVRSSESSSTLTPTSTVYRVYDEKTGAQVGGDYDTAANASAAIAAENKEKEYRVYVIYIYGNTVRLNNVTTDVTGGFQYVNSSHTYEIVTNQATANKNETGEPANIAFLNKLELIAKVQFNELISTETTETTETEETTDAE